MVPSHTPRSRTRPTLRSVPSACLVYWLGTHMVRGRAGLFRAAATGVPRRVEDPSHKSAAVPSGTAQVLLPADDVVSTVHGLVWLPWPGQVMGSHYRSSDGHLVGFVVSLVGSLCRSSQRLRRPPPLLLIVVSARSDCLLGLRRDLDRDQARVGVRSLSPAWLVNPSTRFAFSVVARSVGRGQS